MSKHGVYVLEQATSFSPPVTATAAMPVFIGTAPVHMTKDPTAINRPILVYSWAEAVAALGYSDDWETWTLCEAMYSQLRLFNVAPIVFINVFNPEKGSEKINAADFPVSDGSATITDLLAMPETIVVKAAGDTGSAYKLGTDYTVGYTEDALKVTLIPGGAILGTVEALSISYKAVNPNSVAAKDVIGGVNKATGKRTGVEVIDEVFPRTRLVPGILAAPGWEESGELLALLQAKAKSVNSLFRSVALVDIPESAGVTYRDVPAWKELHGLSSEFCIACWPRVQLGDKRFHLSTQLAGRMGRTDYDNGDVPFASPSNQSLYIDGLCLADGTEVVLDHSQANYLGDNGIVTALNWIGGWKAWGNRTCTYPASADPKDAWIPSRRMFNWVTNSIVLSYWRRISLPIRRILIDDIVTSVNIWLKGLVSAGQLVGGRIEFLAADNPQTAIMDGKIKFRIYICTSSPAQEIEFVLEYDPAYWAALAA